MKFPATIFAIFLSVLTLQPIFGSQEMNVEKQCCSKKKCSKECNDTPYRDQRCQNNGCNPFMACAYGNFYLNEKIFSTSTPVIIKRNRMFVFDDNRIAGNLSDCWHPPRPGI